MHEETNQTLHRKLLGRAIYLMIWTQMYQMPSALPPRFACGSVVKEHPNFERRAVLLTCDMFRVKGALLFEFSHQFSTTK